MKREDQSCLKLRGEPCRVSGTIITLGDGVKSLSGTELSGSEREGSWMNLTYGEIGDSSPEG